MVNAEADEFLRCSAFGSLWINRRRLPGWRADCTPGREIGFRPTTSGLPLIVLQKSFCGLRLKFLEHHRRDDRIITWGTTLSGAKLTGDSDNGSEATLTGDCRLFRSFAEN